jgi:flagellar FliL protein
MLQGFRRMLRAAMMVLVCCLSSAHAGGGGDQGGGAPLKFTTNLGASRYLQFEVVLEAANPEADHHLAMYKPRLQHEIILMLSGESQENLQTLKGKLELQAKIQEIANHIIHETPKSGIKDVLFTSFIIQ